jgi:D-tyrosyl-tRNA(Tyr) deacylase
MICVLQRVKNATVYADGVKSGEIGKGLYLLLGVMKGDSKDDAVALAEKISKLRIFTDENDKMNLSVNDISGEVMVVSNFTLSANYKKGNRPDYLDSAHPDEANALYELFKAEMAQRVKRVASGVFGADMRTEMATDGPVTIVMNADVLLKKG